MALLLVFAALCNITTDVVGINECVEIRGVVKQRVGIEAVVLLKVAQKIKLDFLDGVFRQAVHQVPKVLTVDLG